MAASPGVASQSKEVVFDLDAVAFSSDHFRMHEFKVKRCPRARPHDWTQCPFAHPGEKARRRDPRRYRYSGTACPEFRKSGCCRRGDACPFAHGVFECWLHPSRYRTQLCTDGSGCKRRVCFFAHSESEIRRPDDDPVVAQCQVQAELAAEVQTLQQQHLTQALTALLDPKGSTGQGASAGLAGGQLNLLTLELLKQATPSPQALPHSGEPAAGNQSLQLALLQQLALVEQVQKQQQQQQEQAQQLLNSLSGQGGAVRGADPKVLQALIAALSQNNLQETLKTQLAEQLKAKNPVLDALNLLASGTVVGGAGAIQAEGHQNGQLQVSAPLTGLNGTVAGFGGAQDVAAVSAALALNGTVGTFDMPGLMGPAVAVDQTGSVQHPGQAPLVHTNGLLDALDTLAPGQLAALRARAAVTGGRRSVDNGVLARSVSDLMGALGTQTSEIASLGNDQTGGGMVPPGFSVPLSAAPQVQSADAGWTDGEALKQAKSLLENLSLLQGGKNGTPGSALMEGINMETLLNANGMSAMNRVTSFDNILEELPKSMSELGAQEGAHLYRQAASMAGGDML